VVDTFDIHSKSQLIIITKELTHIKKKTYFFFKPMGEQAESNFIDFKNKESQ